MNPKEEFLKRVYKHKSQGLTYLASIGAVCEELEISEEDVSVYLDETLLAKLTLEVKDRNLIRNTDIKTVNVMTNSV
jgi:hypothetical protein